MNKSNIYKRVASKLKKRKKMPSQSTGAYDKGAMDVLDKVTAKAKDYTPSAAARRAAAKAVARKSSSMKTGLSKSRGMGAYDKGTMDVAKKMMDPKSAMAGLPKKKKKKK